MQGSFKQKILKPGAFARISLCNISWLLFLAATPALGEAQCSLHRSPTSSLLGGLGLASGARSAPRSRHGGCQLLPTRLRLWPGSFCPQSQDPPRALPSFAAEGLLPGKRSLRERSGMLVMWPRLQQHPILLAGTHFSGDLALLAHAGEWAEQTCSQVPPKT